MNRQELPTGCPIALSTLLYKISIPGRTMVKKNTQRVVGFGKAKHAIYSNQFKAWNTRAHIIMHDSKNQILEPIDCQIFMNIRFYFLNKGAQADLSNLIDGPQDCLKNAGIIVDDRLIEGIYARKFFGEKPRCEIELFRLDG